MTREMLAAAVMVWLFGALVGWFTGWAARGEQNRAWHHNLHRQLTETRAQLDDALQRLDDAHAQVDEAQVDDARARWLLQSAPVVVHVHMPAQLPGIPQSLDAAPARALNAVPVRLRDEVGP